MKFSIWITSFFCWLILTSADLRRKTLKAPYSLASCFAVSKEPFDFEIFSSLFSFSLLDFYIYHLFLMPIIWLSVLNVKDLGTLQMQVCMAAQSSSSRRLLTRLNSVQTTQIKDLMPSWLFCVFKRYWKLLKAAWRYQKLRQAFQRVRFCARWRAAE